MKKTIVCSALAFLAMKANAQVEDISVTLSPTASYNWFDNNTSIEDGLMVGGRIGFGLGESLELRGIYEQSVDVKNSVKDIKLPESLASLKNDLKSRKVTVKRWGGEFKANVPTGGSLAPYVTLGSGVQSLETDDLKDEQIYLSAGLGAKINLSDRIVLNLEGKNTAFNLNKSNILFNKADASKFEEFIKDTKDERMYNWSVLAGLQIYLGGREPGSLSDLDKAYLRKFSGGLSGFKFVVEPSAAYVDFNKDLPYSDTYLVGGSAGFDFNRYVGLRAFYYQATKDEKFKKFDNLAMYGGELFARLNVARGISPYLTLGGGYLNVYENSYSPKLTATSMPQDSYFVKGGLGLNVPISKYFELFGSANLLYSTSKKADNLADLQKPTELKQSKMYTAGVRFNLGASSDVEDVLQQTLADNAASYKARIKELEKELDKAYKENNAEKAVEVIKEKQLLEKESKSVEVVPSASKEDYVSLTPEELQQLVSQTIDEVNAGYAKKISEQKKSEEVNQKIQRLENLLIEANKVESQNKTQEVKVEKGDASATQQILNELKSLNAKVDNNTQKISVLANNDSNIANVTESVQPTNSTLPVVAKTKDGERGVVKSLLVAKGASVDAGVVVGNSFSPVVGLRAHYGFSNSNFELQPGVYFGVIGKKAFGVNANAVYKFNFERGVVAHPYVGAGVGYNQLDGESNLGANLVVGTSFNVLNGNLYVDYSALDLAKYNKISVGYKFGF